MFNNLQNMEKSSHVSLNILQVFIYYDTVQLEFLSNFSFDYTLCQITEIMKKIASATTLIG
jgi:hypothetical protein